MSATYSRRTTAPDRESGVALVLGIMFTVIISGLVVSGTLVIKAHRDKTETSFQLHGQATQFARAGLIEALGWFRKQSAQPVTNFVPQYLPAADPPVLDTMDADIGIVREFQITGTTYGRYEVWKKWNTDPDPTRLVWRKKVQCEDISTFVGASGSGNVWRTRSIGYVFEMKDTAKKFDEKPNRVLSSAILETEIRRMTLAPPGEAAVCVKYGGSTTVDNKVNVHGVTGAGIYYKSGTGSVSVINGAKISGSPGLASSSSYDDAVTAVFGVSEQDLRTLADDRITALVDFPDPVPNDTLYFVDLGGTLTLTPALPLKGNAVVYVKGNVDIQYNTKSFFTGLLYVDGNLTIREPFEFNGTIICTGATNIWGSSDWINISYDDAALSDLRTQIGQYRLSSSIRSVTSGE